MIGAPWFDEVERAKADFLAAALDVRRSRGRYAGQRLGSIYFAEPGPQFLGWLSRAESEPEVEKAAARAILDLYGGRVLALDLELYNVAASIARRRVEP